MATSRRSRRQQTNHRTGLFLGLAGAMVAMLLVYQVFVRTDDATPKSLGPVPAGSAAGKDSSPTSSPQEPILPNGSFEELSVRDPFQAPTQYTPSGGSTSTTQPTTSTTSSGTISTTPTTSPAQNPAATTDVALLDVYTSPEGVQTARIRVGGVEYTVVAGQVFATNYKLISFASDTCVNLTYADSPFSLCQGEQVTK
jgi:cytoskeletal protein RodZ